MDAERHLLQVLVVEDDPGDVALVESAFAEHSLSSELHHVADGGEALAFLHQEEPYGDAPRPDLILLDLNMPKVDGRPGQRVRDQAHQPRRLRAGHQGDPQLLRRHRRAAQPGIGRPAGLT
jgi:CheY-like chemotaxis protein